MGKKQPDQRKKPLLKRLTEREYGGKGSVPTQDARNHFGRGTPRAPRPIRPMGKGV